MTQSQARAALILKGIDNPTAKQIAYYILYGVIYRDPVIVRD